MPESSARGRSFKYHSGATRYLRKSIVFAAQLADGLATCVFVQHDWPDAVGTERLIFGRSFFDLTENLALKSE
jgi:hypothetical protein